MGIHIPSSMGSQLELRVEFPIVSRFHMTKLNMAIPKVSQIAIVKHGNVLAKFPDGFLPS